MNTVQWPDEFVSDARAGKRVIAISPDSFDKSQELCPNCGGHKLMMAFYPVSGPTQQHPGKAITATWLPDHGGWFVGEYKTAPCPACSTPESRAAWLRKNCGLDSAGMNIRLEHFLSYAGKEEAREVAKNLLIQHEKPAGLVTFWGGYGVGKTMLLQALVNGFRLAGHMAYYTTMADMLGSVRERFGDNTLGAAEALIHDYKGVRVLAIDEYDRVNLTAWAQETMFRVIDHRYRTMRERLTILATNSDPTGEDGPLGYVSSRLTQGQIVKVGGSDMRSFAR